MNWILTNVAKLGSRELDPLRLPFPIGGLASGDSLFLSISGVSSILEFSIFQIETSALVSSRIYVAKTIWFCWNLMPKKKPHALGVSYRGLRRVHWPIWLCVIVNFRNTNTLTERQYGLFNCSAMQILLANVFESWFDLTWINDPKEIKFKYICQASLTLCLNVKIGFHISVPSRICVDNM